MAEAKERQTEFLKKGTEKPVGAKAPTREKQARTRANAAKQAGVRE